MFTGTALLVLLAVSSLVWSAKFRELQYTGYKICLPLTLCISVFIEAAL